MKEPEAQRLINRMRQINATNIEDTSATVADIVGIPKAEFANLVELMEHGFKALFNPDPNHPAVHECTQCYLCNTWTPDERSHQCPVIEL